MTEGYVIHAIGHSQRGYVGDLTDIANGKQSVKIVDDSFDTSDMIREGVLVYFSRRRAGEVKDKLWNNLV